MGQWQGGDAECGHERPTLGATRQGVDGGPRLDNGAWPNNTCGHCGAIQQPAGMGLEPTLGEWVANIVAVMREVRRVLRDDGTVWLNLGDAYSNSSLVSRANGIGLDGNQRHGSLEAIGKTPSQPLTIANKNLMGQPWRVAFALQDDGWILRSAIVWHKPNPMPESVTDRCTNAYEMVFLLVKSGSRTFWTHMDGYGSRTKPAPDYRMVNGKMINMWRGHDYFYDAESIRQPHAEGTIERFGKNPMQSSRQKFGDAGSVRANQSFHESTPNGLIGGANARNVWTIPTQGRSDAHFATFPNELPRRAIMAGTSERGVCGECGSPWVRVVDRSTSFQSGSGKAGNPPNGKHRESVQSSSGSYDVRMGPSVSTQTLGWQPTCGCNADIQPATVLDCFAGSGTTLAVAQALGRKSVGLDLNPEYLEIAKRYISKADGITLSLGV